MKESEHRPVSSLPWLPLVQQQVESLRFGVVQIVVHEGRVVQIERTEKVRLQNQDPTASSPREH